jgi:hypothetical protein
MSNGTLITAASDSKCTSLAFYCSSIICSASISSISVSSQMARFGPRFQASGD